MKFIVFALLLCFVNPCNEAAQDSIKQELDSVTSSFPFNGIVSVEKDGVSIYEKASNNLSLEDVSSNSLFFIGSITKQMLAAIVLKQTELGVLNLYTPIIDCLPGLARVPGIETVTLESLLTHTSGLIPARGRKKEDNYKFDVTNRGVLNYANQGYELAAKIVTQESGKSLGTLYRDLFLQCDMKDSFIITDETCEINSIKATYPRLVQGFMYVPKLHALIFSTGIMTDAWKIKGGYSQVKQPFIEGFQYLYPESGNVVSSASDLHKWNQCFGKIFKDKLTAQEYTRPRVFNIHDNSGTYHYCLGLCLASHEPIEYRQSGWIYGYQSTSVYFPKQKISVVILENASRIGGLKTPPLDFSTHEFIVRKVREYIASTEKD